MCKSKAEGGRRCMGHLSKGLGPGFHEAYTKFVEAAKEYASAPEPAAPVKMAFEPFDQRMRTDDQWASEILAATTERAKARGVPVTEDLAREVAQERLERARGPIRLYERTDHQMRGEWQTMRHDKAKKEFAERYEQVSAEIDNCQMPPAVRAEARNVVNAMVAETHAGRDVERAYRNRDFDTQEQAAARRREAQEFKRRSTEELQVALGHEPTKVEAEPIPKPRALNPRSMRPNTPIDGPPMLAKESKGLPKLGDTFTGMVVCDRQGNTLWAGEFSGSIRSDNFRKFFEEADTDKIGQVYFNTRRPVPTSGGALGDFEYETIVTGAHITTLKASR